MSEKPDNTNESLSKITADEVNKLNDFAHEDKIEGESSNTATEVLYVEMRKKLNKINRVSRGNSSEEETPSKSGVVVESNSGKFDEIKARFDKELTNQTAENSKMLSFDLTGKRIVNQITRGRFTCVDYMSDEFNSTTSESSNNNSDVSDDDADNDTKIWEDALELN